MRLIDADALKKTLEDMCSASNNIKQRQVEDIMLHNIFPQIVDDEPTIEAKPDNGWISVKDRLPEDDVDVLLHDTYCGTLMGWYDKQDGIFKSDHISRLDAVTRWIPLPEPPKGE